MALEDTTYTPRNLAPIPEFIKAFRGICGDKWKITLACFILTNIKGPVDCSQQVKTLFAKYKKGHNPKPIATEDSPIVLSLFDAVPLPPGV